MWDIPTKKHGDRMDISWHTQQNEMGISGHFRRTSPKANSLEHSFHMLQYDNGHRLTVYPFSDTAM